MLTGFNPGQSFRDSHGNELGPGLKPHILLMWFTGKKYIILLFIYSFFIFWDEVNI